MKAKKQKTIAQVPQLLIDAGHPYVEIVAAMYDSYHKPITRGNPHVWFISQGLLYPRLDNRPVQVRKNEETGRWEARRNRGRWWPLADWNGGADPQTTPLNALEQQLDGIYTRYFADLIVGANDDDAVSEGRSVQGGDDSQGPGSNVHPSVSGGRAGEDVPGG